MDLGFSFKPKTFLKAKRKTFYQDNRMFYSCSGLPFTDFKVQYHFSHSSDIEIKVKGPAPGNWEI